MRSCHTGPSMRAVPNVLVTLTPRNIAHGPHGSLSTHLTSPKPLTVLLHFKLSLPPFVFLLLDPLLAIKLLHSIIIFTFPLPGRLLYSLELCCFALSLPLFPDTPIAVVRANLAAQRARD